MEINNIKQLERGKLYWIQIKGADLKEMMRVGESLDKFELNYLITDDTIDFKQAPEGMILKKTEKGFIIEPN